MKKTLIALAVLAASGAAMAQSSVTLYGVLDIGFGKVKGQKWGMNDGEGYRSNTANPDGFNSTSVIGFRGTEDLGGGLKANFNLQTGGLDLSSAGTGLSFNREAWVGLEGASWGAVQFGRSSSVAAKVMGGYDFNGTSYSSAYDRAGVSAVTWYGSSRRSSQVQYVTPNFGGFTVRAGFTTKGDNEIGSASTNAGTYAGYNATLGPQAKAQYTLGATFANGPLSVSAVAETKAREGLRTAYAVGASYDMKVVKLAATYNRREARGNDGWNTIANGTGQGAGGNGWTLAAVAPLGAANVGVQYARNTGADISAVELFANYALSKRTRLYTDFVKTIDQNSVPAAGAVPLRPSSPYAVGVGVVHTF